MIDTNRIHCKFCDWSTLKAFRTKGGKFSGPDKAQDRLIAHCQQHHPNELQKVRDLIDAEDYDRTNP